MTTDSQTASSRLRSHVEIDDEVLSTVIQLHTGLAALKGERAS